MFLRNLEIHAYLEISLTAAIHDYCFPPFQVICSVLQIINQIIKDNTDFQENACLVGLVSTNAIRFLCFVII